VGYVSVLPPQTNSEQRRLQSLASTKHPTAPKVGFLFSDRRGKKTVQKGHLCKNFIMISSKNQKQQQIKKTIILSISISTGLFFAYIYRKNTQSHVKKPVCIFISVDGPDILSAPVCVRWHTGRCNYAQAGLNPAIPV